MVCRSVVAALLPVLILCPDVSDSFFYFPAAKFIVFSFGFWNMIAGLFVFVVPSVPHWIILLILIIGYILIVVAVSVVFRSKHLSRMNPLTGKNFSLFDGSYEHAASHDDSLAAQKDTINSIKIRSFAKVGSSPVSRPQDSISWNCQQRVLQASRRCC